MQRTIPVRPGIACLVDPRTRACRSFPPISQTNSGFRSLRSSTSSYNSSRHPAPSAGRSARFATGVPYRNQAAVFDNRTASRRSFQGGSAEVHQSRFRRQVAIVVTHPANSVAGQIRPARKSSNGGISVPPAQRRSASHTRQLSAAVEWCPRHSAPSGRWSTTGDRRDRYWEPRHPALARAKTNHIIERARIAQRSHHVAAVGDWAACGSPCHTRHRRCCRQQSSPGHRRTRWYRAQGCSFANPGQTPVYWSCQ